MKLIKNSKDHAEMLKRLEELMIADPKPGTPKDEEMELLAFLIADYESRTVKIPAATPAEAIRFRMEQAGLNQQDLVPFIGSKGRVSEVLSGKRELTLVMVCKLHEGLGIPLKSLVGDAPAEVPPRIDTKRYPVKEMFIRGFFAAAFGTDWSNVKERAEEMLQDFFAGRQDGPIGAFNRQTASKKSKVDVDAVHAWRCRVLDRAAALRLPDYKSAALTGEFIKDLSKLSCLNDAEEIKAAAKKLSIHSAVIAGRLRREANDYRKHRTLIGQSKVKELFNPA